MAPLLTPNPSTIMHLQKPYAPRSQKLVPHSQNAYTPLPGFSTLTIPMRGH